MEGILDYQPWLLGVEAREIRVIEGRRHGKGLVVQLAGFQDRDQAMSLVGQDIAVRREQLPPASADEYYWIDLEGLTVVNVEGVELGIIDHLFSTGVNDVMVLKGAERERLVPFVWDDVVKDVDLERRVMRIDWDPTF